MHPKAYRYDQKRSGMCVFRPGMNSSARAPAVEGPPGQLVGSRGRRSLATWVTVSRPVHACLLCSRLRRCRRGSRVPSRLSWSIARSRGAARKGAGCAIRQDYGPRGSRDGPRCRAAPDVGGGGQDGRKGPGAEPHWRGHRHRRFRGRRRPAVTKRSTGHPGAHDGHARLAYRWIHRVPSHWHPFPPGWRLSGAVRGGTR